MKAEARGNRRAESVLVIIHTDNKDVLLLERVNPFKFWQSVTGSLQAAESHADAARREVAEETGLCDTYCPTYTGVNRLFTIDPRWRKRFPPGVTENVEYEYRLAIPQRADVTIAPDEHSTFEWLSIDDAIERVWSWTNKRALEQLRIVL